MKITTRKRLSTWWLGLGVAMIGACGTPAGSSGDAGDVADASDIGRDGATDAAPPCDGDLCLPGCGEGPITSPCLCGEVPESSGYCCGDAHQDTACEIASPGCRVGSTQLGSCMIGGIPGFQTRPCLAGGVWGAWDTCVPDPDAPSVVGPLRYVSYSGPDVVDDPSHGTDTAPWRTLQYAVNQLQAGDTLMVRSGIYTQAVTINVSGTSGAPITIRAEVPHMAKLMGGLTINGQHVTLYGLDIEQPDSGVGIILNAAQGAKIVNNKIHDCPRYGIHVTASAVGYRIANNVLTYNGQVGIAVNGADGLIENNKILEVVAYHPKLPTVVISNGDDADGMILRGSGHTIRRNLIANFADPRDTHNYYLPEPIHNAHADCFDTRELNDTTIEGNYCYSSFHVSKGIIFNASAVARADITIRNNIFEYRDIGISAYSSPDISSLFIYNNLVKARIDDVIESYLNPGTTADIPGSGIRIADISNYAVFNNLTVDCDNHTTTFLTGNPIEISGGSGISDYNFSWNSDDAPFSGATPGAHGSLTLVPQFESFDTSLHGENDYRLQATSPLIGLGTDGVLDEGGILLSVPDDMTGLARPQDGTVEPGPFEYSASTQPSTIDWISAHVDSGILTLTPTSCAAPSSAVTVEKAKWRGDRRGALVIQFDDSSPGHSLCGLAALGGHGLKGTWYLNPGNPGFTGSAIDPVTSDVIVLADRWAEAPSLGQELANHTMHHSDVTGYDLWRAEVSDAADVIWTIRHGLPLSRNASLMAFNSSASVAWDWAPREKVAILSELSAVDRQTYMGPAYHVQANPAYSVPAGSLAPAMYCGQPGLTVDAAGSCINSVGDAVISGVPQAIANSVVYTAAFHGILSDDTDGCTEYTSGATDGGNAGVAFTELEAFLDLVVAAQDELWVAGAVELFKYAQEQQRSNVRMHQACADRVYFDLASPLGPLYDEALTLIVTVPDDWSTCAATQDTIAKGCAIRPDGTVLIDATPNAGRILLTKTS